MKNVILNKNLSCPKDNFNKSPNTNDSESSFKLEDGKEKLTHHHHVLYKGECSCKSKYIGETEKVQN